VFVLTLLIGVLCGLAAVAFHLAIQSAEALLIDRALAAPAPASRRPAAQPAAARSGATR
jgi:hypothetical protein